MNKNFVITLLSMLLAIAVAVITVQAVTTWKNNQEQSKEQTVQSEDYLAPSITIDDRIDSWKIEKDWEESYDIYLNLSETTLREILKKVGADADVSVIAHEYEENINYYIKSLIKNKLFLNKDSIPGVDSLNIEAIKKKEDNDKIIQLSKLVI